MHTIETLKSKDFDFEINGQKASLKEIFPGFNENDRIGIVTRTPGGSMGANALIMSALTWFYDFFRPELGDDPGKLRIYPDYFVLHVGKRYMNHTMIDVWPPHKDVVVEEDDPEQILEAINDRGITRLVVEDIPPTSPTFLRETVSSAKRRIVSALAYSSTGRVDQADVTIKGCAESEKNVMATMHMSEELSDMKDQLQKNRDALLVDDRPVETYRRIDPADAIKKLTPSTEFGSATRSYLDVLGNNPKFLTTSW
ncbi:hypothetical protein [Alteribacillus bidgolensis]|nr:hypothetical protein [Alteribacillus bidgolensis]